LPDALELARKELELRQDVYTWDTLAWVLYKNGQFKHADDAMNKALRLHTLDPMLLFHAGMIEHSLGLDSLAKSNLHAALKINPQFHIFYAETAARTLGEIASLQNQNLRSSNVPR
jgi:tetratricopeptide (TPR) repeat protein